MTSCINCSNSFSNFLKKEANISGSDGYGNDIDRNDDINNNNNENENYIWYQW